MSFFEIVEDAPQNAVIKVIGVGGGGGNAVRHMIANSIDGVEFICANTDSQALDKINARTAVKLGTQITKGLGAGANPDVGRSAAMEDRDRIREVIEGADMVFITAGMGGGTGTGAAPVVAEVARELGILTVAVVTKPFGFEGRKRALVADQGIRELAEHVDSLITIPNEKLMAVLGSGASLLDAFAKANDVLLGAVKGIADLITRDGLINVDFADVKTVMSEMGMAMMGSGRACGEQRAVEAAEAAIRSPLLEDVNLQGARGILVNITASESLTLGEYSQVGNTIAEFASEQATVIVGTVIDPEMGDDISVTVVATGLASAVLQRLEKPTKVVDNVPRTPPRRMDYHTLDKPAVTRRQAASRPEPQAHPVYQRAVGSDADLDFLDIPAFLRKQAD
ncbi:MAG TPA: cell division protein FtsZ [Hyphomicrobiales bacterium]|nr:cell division protein FtsZ [Hyphomicrobiales bacterium]